jgi:dihydroorotase-like cyclic amidohydrolase
MGTQVMRLPGFIDTHVHLRVPGGEHKEDFRSGTAAALASGITMVMAMPNTAPPILSADIWKKVQTQAIEEGLCDVLQFAGATAASLADLPELALCAPALKVYLDPTYGHLKVNGYDDLSRIAQTWPKDKMIALHAEGESMRVGIDVSIQLQRPIHFCHVSRKEEIEMIARAKTDGAPITCEVTPHHLFLTSADALRLGALGDMRPKLADQRDVDALWANLNSTIDIIATDHAPHTLAEKNDPLKAPPGVPGLESALPLLLAAVNQKRLSIERLVALMHTNPRRIYSLPEQPNTWVEVDLNECYTFPDHPLYTKCSWSPFSGFKAQGRILKVVLRGREVMSNGIVSGHHCQF